jgi:hypothetical protein
LVQLTMKNMISEVQIQRTLSKPPEIRNGWGKEMHLQVYCSIELGKRLCVSQEFKPLSYLISLLSY